jgi:phospholipid/cholesterol/gamma-HCH transport system ATP-binding protein
MIQEKTNIDSPTAAKKNVSVIEIKDLHKSFGKNEVLKGINLSVIKVEN